MVAVVAQWLIGIVAHTYRDRYLLGSVDEVINLAKVMFVVGLVVLGVDLLPDTVWVPRSPGNPPSGIHDPEKTGRSGSTGRYCWWRGADSEVTGGAGCGTDVDAFPARAR